MRVGWVSGRSGRSQRNPDNGNPDEAACSLPVSRRDAPTHYVVTRYFSYLVILPSARFLLLNSNLQYMQSGIPMLCCRTVALKQSWAS